MKVGCPTSRRFCEKWEPGLKAQGSFGERLRCKHFSCKLPADCRSTQAPPSAGEGSAPQFRYRSVGRDSSSLLQFLHLTFASNNSREPSSRAPEGVLLNHVLTEIEPPPDRRLRRPRDAGPGGELPRFLCESDGQFTGDRPGEPFAFSGSVLSNGGDRHI